MIVPNLVTSSNSDWAEKMGSQANPREKKWNHFVIFIICLIWGEPAWKNGVKVIKQEIKSPRRRGGRRRGGSLAIPGGWPKLELKCSESVHNCYRLNRRSKSSSKGLRLDWTAAQSISWSTMSYPWANKLRVPMIRRPSVICWKAASSTFLKR